MGRHRHSKYFSGDDVATEQDLREIFFGEGSEPITIQLIEQLVRQGWDRMTLLDARKGGAVYNRQRHTILFPPQFFES